MYLIWNICLMLHINILTPYYVCLGLSFSLSWIPYQFRSLRITFGMFVCTLVELCKIHAAIIEWTWDVNHWPLTCHSDRKRIYLTHVTLYSFRRKKYPGFIFMLVVSVGFGINIAMFCCIKTVIWNYIQRIHKIFFLER